MGKVDQIGLRRTGKGRRRIAGRGQIDTTDVQPLQHLRPGGEFDPAYGNALFFRLSSSVPRYFSSAKIFAF